MFSKDNPKMRRKISPWNVPSKEDFLELLELTKIYDKSEISPENRCRKLNY